MIKLWIALQNPFKCSDFKNYGCKVIPLSTNKTLELQATHYAYNWFEINLDLNWKGSDHAGPSFEVNLFGYTAIIKMYDNRHWDHETHDWVKYDDDPCETV